MVWAWLCLTDRIQEHFLDGARRILTVAAVLGISIRLWLFHAVIVDTFTNGPAQLAQIIVGASSPVSLVDDILLQGSLAGQVFWDRAGVTDMGGYFAACAIYGAIIILCALTAGLLLLAKIGTAGVLVIGPLFIVFLLFDTTKRFFENWVSGLATMSFITILVAIFGSMLLYVVSKYAASAVASGASVTVAEIIVMLAVGGAIFYVLCQTRSIAAQLGGGIALGSYNVIGRAIAKGLGTAQQVARGSAEGALGIARTKYDSVPRLAGNVVGQAVRGALAGGPGRQGGTVSRDRFMPPSSVR
jgi:type IV secretion system protein VirB6